MLFVHNSQLQSGNQISVAKLTKLSTMLNYDSMVIKGIILVGVSLES